MADIIHITAFADWTEILITDAVSSWILPTDDSGIRFQSTDAQGTVHVTSKRIFMGKRQWSSAISTLTVGINAPQDSFAFRICKGASGKVTIRSSADERVNDITGGGTNCAAYKMFVNNRAKRDAEDKNPDVADSGEFAYFGIRLAEETVRPF